MKLAALCVTYDRPKFLGELIECFLRQDWPKESRELIILDDAGQYENQEGDGWRLISIPRRFHTLGEKRNACAALASPDVEGFLVADDDDIYLPHWFKASAEALKQADWSRPSFHLSEQNNQLKASPTQGLYHASWAVRKEMFYRVSGYTAMNSGEDQNLGHKLIQAGATICDPCQWMKPFFVHRWNTGSYHMSSADYQTLGQRKIRKATLQIGWSKPWDQLPIILPNKK